MDSSNFANFRIRRLTVSWARCCSGEHTLYTQNWPSCADWSKESSHSFPLSFEPVSSSSSPVPSSLSVSSFLSTTERTVPSKVFRQQTRPMKMEGTTDSLPKSQLPFVLPITVRTSTSPLTSSSPISSRSSLSSSSTATGVDIFLFDNSSPSN